MRARVRFVFPQDWQSRPALEIQIEIPWTRMVGIWGKIGAQIRKRRAAIKREEKSE